jgi:hypothetical protein
MIFKKEKIVEFVDYTIDEYMKSLLVEDIASVKHVKKADGSFTQIGIRPVIGEDIFIASNIDPKLPSAGRVIAVGERDYLINQILNNDKIKREGLDKPAKFVNYLISNETIVLLSTKFYVEVFTDLMNRVQYGEKHPKLDGINYILAVPEKVLGNKIIIIEKGSILWEKVQFKSPVTEKNELIKIDIEHKNAKADITIKSLNKMYLSDLDSIKILEVRQ